MEIKTLKIEAAQSIYSLVVTQRVMMGCRLFLLSWMDVFDILSQHSLSSLPKTVGHLNGSQRCYSDEDAGLGYGYNYVRKENWPSNNSKHWHIFTELKVPKLDISDQLFFYLEPFRIWPEHQGQPSQPAQPAMLLPWWDNINQPARSISHKTALIVSTASYQGVPFEFTQHLIQTDVCEV